MARGRLRPAGAATGAKGGTGGVAREGDAEEPVARAGDAAFVFGAIIVHEEEAIKSKRWKGVCVRPCRIAGYRFFTIFLPRPESRAEVPIHVSSALVSRPSSTPIIAIRKNTRARVLDLE